MSRLETIPKEFKIGDKVTLDRYNHLDDTQKVEVVGYGIMPLSERLTYKLKVDRLIIESTGASIMESKHYDPVPDDERHDKVTASDNKIEPYWI